MDDRLVVIDVQYSDSYGGVGTTRLLSSVTGLHNQLITRERRGQSAPVRQFSSHLPRCGLGVQCGGEREEASGGVNVKHSSILQQLIYHITICTCREQFMAWPHKRIKTNFYHCLHQWLVLSVAVAG